MSELMLAYHGDPAVKRKYLNRVRAHRLADELVQGVGYESNGKTRACGIGCTLNAYDHSRYPVELGIPEVIAHLEDAIFEGLPREEALKWPEAFLKAIKPGADLSMVWPRWTLWLLSSEDSPNYKPAQHPTVKASIDGVAALYREWVETGVKPAKERFDAAAAARAAEASSWAAGARAAAARAAARAARLTAWRTMAAKLLELLSAAPKGSGVKRD